MLRFLAAFVFAAILPAAAQTPLDIDGLLPTIQPSGLTAHLTPFISIPANAATPPLTRITHVQQLTDGSGRYFTSDLDGTIYRTGPGGGVATPYVNIANQNVGLVAGPFLSGPGLGGFAFHPNFGIDSAKPGYDTFYTTTTVANTGQATNIGGNGSSNNVEIREWTALDPAAATFTGTSRLVISIGGDNGSNSFISFNTAASPGSADYGNLYIGTADGSYNDVEHKAQNLGTPQGKIIRINPLAGPNGASYTIPGDNPFVNTQGALPEVWASGLRYPQTFNWDSVTGAMYINDLGEAAIEEVNLGTPGADYGWGMREGTFATGDAYGFGPDDYNIYPIPPGGDAQGYTDPIAQYDHTEGRALGSGFVYRGTAIPGLYGKYVMADIVNGRLFTFDPAAAAASGGQAPLSELLLTQDGQPLNLDATYGYDNPWNDGKRLDARLQQTPDGELLLAFKANGQVYELTQDIPEPATLALLAALLPLLVRHSRQVTSPT